MIEYSKVKLNRLEDKASPTYLNVFDRIRSFWKLKSKKIKAGKDIVCKKNVEFAICKNGKLIVGDGVFFHAGCWMLLTLPNPIVEIGRYVYIGRNTIIACKNSIKIGDFSIFAPNCYVIDHEHGFSKNDIILNQKSVLNKVVIGRDCYFGTNSIILGGVNIGDGSIIGANSVVNCDIPPYQIWAGSPAKFIRER